MSITVSSLITNVDTFFGDSTTDRVSTDQRYQALTEATAWLLEELGNEHMVETFDLEYLDTINYYKVTGSIPDLLTGADLRREVDNYYSFSRKSPREMSEEIARKDSEPSWAIERKNTDIFLVINADPRNKAIILSNLDSTTDWSLDTTNSDATNLRVDSFEKRYGAASLAFDIDVSQSGNNKATVYSSTETTTNLENLENNGSELLEVYIPDVTETSSVTFVWGSDLAVTPATKANYWSATVTTDIDGEAFSNGWNTVKIDWNTATMTGTPDSASIAYKEININYTASQTDDTHYRINFLRAAKPEKLVLHYISWNVGQVSAANPAPITVFSATTNVPFFSDKYDSYRYPVAHKAASILFSAVRLRVEAGEEEQKADDSLKRYRKNFESSKTREVKSFKVMGVNLRRRNKSGRIR